MLLNQNTRGAIVSRPRSGQKDFRFSVSVSEEMRYLLEELSTITGQPRSSLAGELLEETKPVLRDMLAAFRAMAEAKQQGKDALVDVINQYAKNSISQIYEVGAAFNAAHGSDSEPAATSTDQEN